MREVDETGDPFGEVDLENVARDNAENHSAAEGADLSEDRLGRPQAAPETEPDLRDSLKSLLMSTDPDAPLESVEAPIDLENGGAPRIARGIRKMLGASGTPAVVDVLVGVLEMQMQQQEDAGGGFTAASSESNESRESDDLEGGADLEPHPMER